MNLLPKMFLASFLAQAGLAAICGAILTGVNLPPLAAEQAGRGRPLSEIVKQRKFIAAIVCGVISYLLMNFVMTAAPLAMKMKGLSMESSDLGLQWHVIAMYGPSLFTGPLIARVGAGRVVLAGLALTGGSLLVGLSGVTVLHFWSLLIPARPGLEFRFPGRVGAGPGMLSPGRAHPRAGLQ